MKKTCSERLALKELKGSRTIILVLFILLPLQVTAQDNLVFNPGFDMTPWDTGWTYSGGAYNGSWAITFSTRYCSPPQSCSLYAYAQSSPGEPGYATAQIWQDFLPAVSCTCRVYYQYSLSGGIYGSAWISIILHLNNKDTIVVNICSSDTGVVRCSTWTKWEQAFSEIDTLSEIYFHVEAQPQMSADYGAVMLLIDDIYVSGMEVGIEEKSNSKNTDYS